jgi:D-3-phosphoglycerate dehydrogenase / 2-oxoglutarate reductase
MTANIKKIVYFHHRLDATAGHIRAAERPDIDMSRYEFSGSAADNWAAMAQAHGYHACARTEMQAPWFPDAALIDKAPNLLAVCSLGAGYDVVDVEACTKTGILVCNQSGGNSEAVAEHAMGFMLALSKKIVLSDRAMRRDANLDRFLYTGNDLMGKTVGIIGLGNIGGRVAELCKILFKMTVLAYDPFSTKEQIAAKHGQKVDLHELLQRSDYVTMHCPRTKESFGMMGYDQFAQMKSSAYFINTSRGGTYREDDLVQILKEKKIAGAGLDVFLDEPPPTNHPLLAFDTVIVSPHNAGVTHEAMANVSKIAAEQWIEILDGRVPPRLINPEVWPKFAQRFECLMGFKPARLD